RLVSDILNETEGNPFFARELFRYLLDEYAIDLTDHRSIPNIRGIAPREVQYVIGRRVAQLSSETIGVLQAATVFSNGFDLSLLSAVIDASQASIVNALEEGLSSNLIRYRDDRVGHYEFSHAIVRSSIYATM